ncbi:MAG TPA: PIG-L family deacetylase [Bryobacteraceae bacterium]|nr:PIG-L family deacetylase [Bryobacteraceae bacterium]
MFVFRPAWAQPEPPSGAVAIEQALGRLNVLGSVLMIAAHPDDENNVVLAWFARGRHYRTAYLSATRGEGGQNLIGPELGEQLGLIRTQELLAARRVDGAAQFFTRAVDFGFSKSASETLQKWGHEQTLSDMVWVIRRYRPDVITATFSGTPRDGHGHHQAAGILAREAFEAAADPARFPEQLRHVQPWRATRLVHHPYFAEPAPGDVRIDGGEFNPVLGRSYAEIAGLSRSMHRSQAMGSPQPKGPSIRYFVTMAGESARKDVFDGIDTTWNRLPGGAAIGRILSAAAASFDPQNPVKTIPALLQARPLIAAIRDPWAAVKLAELDETVALCAGLWLDAEADRWAATPGSTLNVTLVALNRSSFPLALAAVDLNGLGARTTEDGAQATLPYNQAFTRQVPRDVPAGQPVSQPYWLEHPRRGDAYPVDDQQLIGLPENAPVLEARFRVIAAGQTLELARPVRYRYVDPVLGELRRPLVIVPPAAVNVSRDVLVFPNPAARKLAVEVAAQAPAEGELRLDTAAGWSATPSSQPYRAASGQRHTFEFQIAPPSRETNGRAGFAASGMRVIAYPHIPPQVWFPPAEVRLVRADIRLTPRRIGYVMGAGDEMPDALRQLGAEVVLLASGDLEQRNLAEFHAIVTGVRAYNVRPDLRANHPRLLEYVKNGGTLLVQYNVLDRSLEGVSIGPYPITIGRGRVSLEEAPVRITDAQSPLLQAPNAITPRDFEGWVQERGLYFASQWDPRYRTVLETSDPGEKPMAGGELWTRYGKGIYIFSAYSWFRQLPAGVPGAYRLFANLLSAK